MQINGLNSHNPSFGIRAPKSVRKRLLNPGFYFTQESTVVRMLDSIGSNATTLAKIKFSNYFGGYLLPSLDCWTTMQMKLKFKTRHTKGIIIPPEKSTPGNSHVKLLFPFSNAVKEGEEAYIERTLASSAKKGKLKEIAKELKEYFPKHKALINRTRLALKEANQAAIEQLAKKQNPLKKFTSLIKSGYTRIKEHLYKTCLCN